MAELPEPPAIERRSRSGLVRIDSGELPTFLGEESRREERAPRFMGAASNISFGEELDPFESSLDVLSEDYQESSDDRLGSSLEDRSPVSFGTPTKEKAPGLDSAVLSVRTSPGSPGGRKAAASAATQAKGSPLHSALLVGRRTPRKKKRRNAWDWRWGAYLAAGCGPEARGAQPRRGRTGDGQRRRKRSSYPAYGRGGDNKSPVGSLPPMARPTRWAKYLTSGVIELMHTFARPVPLEVTRRILDYTAYDVVSLVNLGAVNMAFRSLCRERRLWYRLDLSSKQLTDGYLQRVLRVAPLQHVGYLSLANVSRTSTRRATGGKMHNSPRLRRCKSQQQPVEATPQQLTFAPLADQARLLFPTLGKVFGKSTSAGESGAPRQKLRIRLGSGLRLRELDLSGNHVLKAETLWAILSRARGLVNLNMTSADQIVNDEKLPLITRALDSSGAQLKVLRMGTRTSYTQMLMKNLERLSDEACAAFIRGRGVGGALERVRDESEGAVPRRDGEERENQRGPTRASSSRSHRAAPGLELLSLRNQTLVSGHTIQAITRSSSARTLRELDLSSCSRLTDDMLIALVAALPVLEAVDLSNCWKLTDQGLRALRAGPDLSDTLHTLRLSGCNFISGGALAAAAAQLPRLAYLDAARLPNVNDEDLQSLARAVGDTVRGLDLSHCDNITREGVAELCLRCLKLESLLLTKCASLSAAFLTDIYAKAVETAKTEEPTTAKEQGGGAGQLEADVRTFRSGLTLDLEQFALFEPEAGQQSVQVALGALSHLNLREVRGFDQDCLSSLLKTKALAKKRGCTDVANVQKLLVGGTLYNNANWDFRDDEKGGDSAHGAEESCQPRSDVGLSDEAIRVLAHDPFAGVHLEVLDLEGHTGISDSSLVQLTQKALRMRLLRLNGLRNITDEFLASLSSPVKTTSDMGVAKEILPMPRLSELHVAWCNGVSNEASESLKKKRPGLQVVMLKTRKLLRTTAGRSPAPSSNEQ